MRSVWLFYAITAAISVIWSMWAGRSLVATLTYPVLGALVIGALSTRQVNRWIDKLPGGHTVQVAITALLAFGLYWAWRIFASTRGW